MTDNERAHALCFPSVCRFNGSPDASYPGHSEKCQAIAQALSDVRGEAGTWRRTLEVMTAERDAALRDLATTRKDMLAMRDDHDLSMRNRLEERDRYYDKARAALAELAQAVGLLREFKYAGLIVSGDYYERRDALLDRHPDTHDAEGAKGSSHPALSAEAVRATLLRGLELARSSLARADAVKLCRDRAAYWATQTGVSAAAHRAEAIYIADILDSHESAPPTPGEPPGGTLTPSAPRVSNESPVAPPLPGEAGTPVAGGPRCGTCGGSGKGELVIVLGHHTVGPCPACKGSGTPGEKGGG